MANNLSQSQIDLVMHGDGDPFAPGHAKPHQYDSDSRKRDKKHNEMFLESEKKGHNGTSKSYETEENDDQTIETSTL